MECWRNFGVPGTIMEDKIADYLLDISKLIFAGMVLGTVLRAEGLSTMTALFTGLCATVITASIAIAIIGRRNK